MLTQNAIQLTADTLLSAEAETSAYSASPGMEEADESNFPYGMSRIGASAPKQILVVDDDPAVRELVARTVTEAGFRADTAQDGEEGWKALCLMSYDLLITDHQMPRLTGLRLIKRLRAVSIEPPCILISGNLPGSESTLQKLVHRGTILAKPFSASALIEKVYGLLLYGDFQEF